MISSDTIAGVTLAHISDQPRFGSHTGKDGYVGFIARGYDKAQGKYATVGFRPTFRGVRDGRVPLLILHDDERFSAPTHTFLTTSKLLTKIKRARDEKGRDLSQDELLVIGLEDTEDAVDPDFSTGAMNAINASYYSSDIAFDASTQLATLFVENRLLNVALGALIAQNTGGTHRRIKELSCGNITGHWAYIAEGLASNGARKAAVTLTDFVEPHIDPKLARTTNLSITTGRYSLLDNLPQLAPEDRFDALITTYGFDSVWQPEDVSLVRLGSQWYKRIYRVKVVDWAPHRKDLLLAMRGKGPLPGATANDYDGVAVETAMEPIDITTHPFARYIVRSGKTSINFPGGLVRRIVEAFTYQLKENGIFVVGDTGDFGFEDIRNSEESDQRISGVVARYRMDDYVLAKQILEAEYGLAVTLLSFRELANGYLPQSWLSTCSPDERRQMTDLVTNGIMLARRE